MLRYRNIGVTVKTGMERKQETVEQVLAILRSAGARVFFDPKRGDDIPFADDFPRYDASQGDIDLLLVIGGDGTILRAVREMRNFSVPVLSVNRGRIGFLAEMTLDEAPGLLPHFLRGAGVPEQRFLLALHARSADGDDLYTGFALNEVVIAQSTIARLVDLRTAVNGEPLTTYRADGLIVSTPTGSTAYSLSAGGPIVHPALSAVILTPLNPHSFTQKPIVIPGMSSIEVEIVPKAVKVEDLEVYLTVDGQVSVPMRHGGSVRIAMDGESVNFLRRKDDTFFGTLREKLKWGERVE